MSFAKEFREFAIKGNVLDMAVGLIIGAAFGKIVTSFVSDIVTPPLGYLIGGVDFTNLKLILPAVVHGQEPATIKYGAFLQTTLDFFIVAFAIFLVVRTVNRMKRKKEEGPPAPSKEELLLTEIRDLLKRNASTSDAAAKT